MPSYYDIFRYIKLYSPDGSTLEQTLEADTTWDSLKLRRGDGVSWSVPTVRPDSTIAVTVGFDTVSGNAWGTYRLDGVEKKAITLQKGHTYYFDQSDASNAGYGGYNSPLVFSNAVDGAISGAITGEEYATGVTYLIDDLPVSKADYKLNFTTTTNRKVKIDLQDSAPTTFYYGSHDNTGQGGTITTTSGDDIMMIDVDYSLDVPPGTTRIELTDINAGTSHVALSSTGGISLVRKNANEIEIGSFAVAETDTLHTVTTRNAITTNKVYIENIEVGNVTSATEDGFDSPSADFLGAGTIDNPLRLIVANREITSNTVTETFTFTAKPAPGILHYTIGYQLDSGTSATSVSASIQKFNGVTWDTLDTVSGIGGIPYEVSNMHNETTSGAQYRVVYAVAGNTGTISLELQAYYEILEITDNPVIRTDTAVGTVWTRDLAPLGVNDIGRGSEPYDNVYANTFHGHLIGTFDGDLTGSLYTDDSTLLVDATSGTIYGSTLADTTSVIGNVEFADNVKLMIGNSDDLQIWHDGLDSYIRDNGTGKLRVQTDHYQLLNAVDNNPFIEATSLGTIIYHNGSDIITTQTTGADLRGNLTLTLPSGTVTAPGGFVGDLTGSVFSENSITVINEHGVLLGDVNNLQVTTANLEASNFTDTVGTITGGAITDFSVQSPVYGTDTTTLLVDVANNQIVGEVNANTNKTGALTIASDTSVAVNGTGVISFNSGVGVDANGKLVNSSNAAQPFIIASPVTLEKEFRASPGIQYVQEYTNVTTGTYAIDASATENVYWNQPSGSVTANITNLDTSNQRLRVIKIFVNQGATPYIPNLEINGVVTAFSNLGPVTGTANAMDVFEFYFYRTHTSTWEVYCKQVNPNALTLDVITTYGSTTTNSITVAGVSAGSGTISTTGAISGGDVTGGNVRVGVTADGEIDTSTGNLTIDSQGGTVTVDDNLTVSGNTILQGNTTIGNAITDTITVSTVTGTPVNTGTVSGYMQITLNGVTRFIPYYT